MCQLPLHAQINYIVNPINYTGSGVKSLDSSAANVEIYWHGKCVFLDKQDHIFSVYAALTFIRVITSG